MPRPRRLLIRSLAAAVALAAVGCSEDTASTPEAADQPAATPLAVAAARAQAASEAAEAASATAKRDKKPAAKTEAPKVAYQPPFPDRIDLFSPPKHVSHTPRASSERSADSVVLMGFANLDGPRVLLAIDGTVKPLADGEESSGVKVISIAPPQAVLQRGRSRWTASIQ